MALTLNFIESSRPVGKPRISQEIRRRDKLVAAIHQQILALEAEINGNDLPKTKKGKAVRTWYWSDGVNKGIAAQVKFGTKPVAFDAKGKNTTFSAPNLKALATIYKQISDEVNSGSLDKQIAAIASTMGRAAKK